MTGVNNFLKERAGIGRTKDKDKTLDEADRLKSSGVIIMAAGGDKGNGNNKLIQRLASYKEKAFMTKNYDELTEKHEEVFKHTCAAAPELESTVKVLFILDSSGSMGDTDYKKELDFVVKLTERFNTGSGAVLFSVMIFSTSPQLLFDFSSLNTHEEMKEATLSAPYLNGGTNTAAALDLARTSVFDIRDGTRNRKIAIVITDGQSDNSDATSDAAGKLKETGVLIIAIGVGNANQRELRRIVSKPGDVYMVEDYDALFRIQDEITQQLTSKHAERLQRRAPEPQADAVGLGGLIDALKFW